MAMDATLVWFLTGLVLVLLEFGVPGVILVFFGLGAWAVTLTTWLGLTASLRSQLLLFAASSVTLLVGLRRWVHGKLHGHVSDVQDLTSNPDEFTGKNVEVLEDIDPGPRGGSVEFKGARWKAVSDVSIGKGEMAVIIGRDGITLRVTKQ